MARFKEGNPGRPRGSKNKKTIALDRVYQRCNAQRFHPADPIIEIAMDPKAPRNLRIQACETLLGFIEGKQKDGKPLTPGSPAESVEAAEALMRDLKKRAEPLEPRELTPAA